MKLVASGMDWVSHSLEPTSTQIWETELVCVATSWDSSLLFYDDGKIHIRGYCPQYILQKPSVVCKLPVVVLKAKVFPGRVGEVLALTLQNGLVRFEISSLISSPDTSEIDYLLEPGTCRDFAATLESVVCILMDGTLMGRYYFQKNQRKRKQSLVTRTSPLEDNDHHQGPHRVVVFDSESSWRRLSPNSSSSSLPIRPPSEEPKPNIKFKKIVAGARHYLALTETSHECYSWGDGLHGQLGLGVMQTSSATTSNSGKLEEEGHSTTAMVPRVIEALQGLRVTHIACGDVHSAVLVDSSILYTFGRDERALCAGRYGPEAGGRGSDDGVDMNCGVPWLVERFDMPPPPIVDDQQQQQGQQQERQQHHERERIGDCVLLCGSSQTFVGWVERCPISGRGKFRTWISADDSRSDESDRDICEGSNDVLAEFNEHENDVRGIICGAGEGRSFLMCTN